MAEHINIDFEELIVDFAHNKNVKDWMEEACPFYGFCMESCKEALANSSCFNWNDLDSCYHLDTYEICINYYKLKMRNI